MASADLLYDLRKCIGELIDCNAFELQLHTDKNGHLNCYIPYMMNDALECYFVLKDCKMTGEHVTGSFENLLVELVDDALGCALVIRQVTDEVSTLWFQDTDKILNCYRYHEIGHFWVKGQEHYRQLVYMIGTIYDKYSYMGKSLCNEEELALLSLMEFAPFRYWSPIHESLDGYYPDTIDGCSCFKELCMEAGDSLLLSLTERYEKMALGTFWITDFYRKLVMPKLVKRIATELVSPGHETLYDLIYNKVCEASSKYPPRDYGEAMNQRIAVSRQEVADTLIAKGFIGEYPKFVKNNISLLVTEEHPFTLSALEYENYDFRIQMMVSETADSRRWIAKSVDEL